MATQITALPTPPSRQRPLDFSNEADAFLGALPAFATEANALALQVNQDATTVAGLVTDIQAELNAATANAVASATASASLSASNAATSANSANQSAVLAQGYEQQAQQYAHVATSASNYTGDWSSDRTYSKGQTTSYGRYIYVSKTDSNLNQIPSASTTTWFEIKTEADLFRQPYGVE